MAIDLAQTKNIPKDIMTALTENREQLKTADFLEELTESKHILDIILALDEIAEKRGVVGYHYTRSLKSSIENNGLKIKTGKDRRTNFLKEYGNIFTREQRQRLELGWESYFDEEQNNSRDNYIWFNLTASAIRNGGADPLLSYYGGEAVYMPFTLDDEISSILKSIGEPLIIRCGLDTKLLNTFTTNPWGKVWLSSYHRSVNPDACQEDFDVYTKHSVSPDKILSIEVFEDDRF